MLVYKQYEIENERLIGNIKQAINSLNRKQYTNIENVQLLKPRCLFQEKIHIIIEYSYSVEDHNLLKYTLKPLEENIYITVYAYHIKPHTVDFSLSVEDVVCY